TETIVREHSDFRPYIPYRCPETEGDCHGQIGTYARGLAHGPTQVELEPRDRSLAQPRRPGDRGGGCQRRGLRNAVPDVPEDGRGGLPNARLRRSDLLTRMSRDRDRRGAFAA